MFTNLGEEIIDSGFQGATINVLSFDQVIANSDELLLNFLKSNFDSRRSCIKVLPKEKQNQFLALPFQYENLSLEDFHKGNRTMLINFFEDFLNGEINETERKHSLNVIHAVKEKLSYLTNEYDFYIISLDEIVTEKDVKEPELASPKLHPDFWCFIYFYSLIAISINDRKLIKIDLFYE